MTSSNLWMSEDCHLQTKDADKDIKREQTSKIWLGNETRKIN